MEPAKKSFGDRLREAREGAGLTQDDLAAKLGVSQKQVSNWELDVSPPMHKRLEPIALAVKATVGWLVSEQGKPPRRTGKAALQKGGRKPPVPGAEEA